MKILFNWCQSFSDNSEWHNDEEILSLEILQKEGSFATAKVSLKNKIIKHKYARIGVEIDEKIQLVFCGKVISFPMNLENSIMQIELLSEPDNYQTQLKTFSNLRWEKYKKIDFENSNEIMFDDLFFSEHEKENPTIFLENENKIFYWNMKNGNLSLSDINRDGKNFEISKNDILKNSIRVKLSREPYGRINLSVSASWIQKVYGFIDIFPMMARRFNLNYVNSFTDISSSFKNIFKNGYSVIYKKINQINPNKGGVLNNYSLVSGAVKIANQGKEKFINFRRFYYNGNFVLNWEYHQKRTENVEISLIDKKYSRCKNVSIKLNAIQLSKDYPNWRGYENYLIDDKVLFGGYVYKCINAHHSGANFSEENWERSEKIPDALSDDQASSFFSTPRGKFSLRYALQKVAALMNYSRRFVTINFHLDANKFWDITVNDQITFSDLFSNKKITAKVIQTKLVCESQRRIMQISAGYSPNYSNDIWEKIRNYEIDISDDFGKVEMNDIVKEIVVENPPEVQEKFLTAQNFSSISEAKSVLKNHPTKIKVRLHPLNRKREIVRKIKLKNLEI